MKTADKSKDKKIKSEVSRLKKIFKNLDENKKKILEPIIESTAFLRVSMGELSEIINSEGYTEEYINGKNQSGIKKSAEVDIYTQMSKNLTANIKLLCDNSPPEDRKESRLAALRFDD